MADEQLTDESLPETCLPTWSVADLPDAKPLGLKNLAGFIGPGIVMCGIQLAGGEWLLGSEITARYGGSLMWIAAIAIVCQVFYNMECGRYALYSGEPVFTGFMRAKPGPRFWIGVLMLLSLGAFIPGLSTHGAAVIAALILDRPPGEEDRWLVVTLAYIMLAAVSLPILVGGKIYNMIEAVMTTKVFGVLGFCLIIGVFAVDGENWANVFSGFFKFGNMPVVDAEDRNNNGELDEGEDFDRDGHLDVIEPRLGSVEDAAENQTWPDFNNDGDPDAPLDSDGDGKMDAWADLNGDGTPEEFVDANSDGIPDQWPDVAMGASGKTDGKPDNFIDLDGDGKWDGENVDNVIVAYFRDGEFPVLLLTQIALLGAFAGYAGGGGLGNSTYSNYVRDKGWGMGSLVGAIPSAVGGRKVSLSHLGTVFPINEENLKRWKGWWRYIITDQIFIWGPGCVMGMALPALLSLQFSPNSSLFHDTARLDWAQSVITADGLRNSAQFGETMQNVLWVCTLIVGMLVLLPSQMSIIEDVCRKWTDIIWSGNKRVRETMGDDKVKNIYYTILGVYVGWTFVCAYVFGKYGHPKLMVLIIANLNNLALGCTAVFLLRVNTTVLPKEIRPRLINRIGMVACATFYLGLAALVFYQKQIPIIKDLLGIE
ncbi:MAG: hypothetical protein CMJ78_24005 [Planctomycetaceae bacterium]|nr:hypothetical protein [Planctomycetaceae bacterium]